MLETPPVGSVMFISGIILNDLKEERTLIPGVRITIDSDTKKELFGIIIRKNKDNYSIRLFPDALKITTNDDNIRLNTFVLYNDIILMDRISFSLTNMTDDEIKYL